MTSSKPDRYKQVFPLARFGLDKKVDRGITGSEHIPDQPAIYVANHIHFVDSLIVAASYTELTGRPLRFAAKKEYFDGRGLDDEGKFGRITKWVMERTLMIPVDREAKSPSAFAKFQTAVADRISQGDSVALHPEGTRSQDGKLHKFKSGASRIAIAEKVPIVPVGLTYAQYDNKKKLHVHVSFGEPIMPSEYTALPHKLLPARQKAEHFIAVAEDRVAELTGMERSGNFAILRKLRSKTTLEETPEV